MIYIRQLIQFDVVIYFYIGSKCVRIDTYLNYSQNVWPIHKGFPDHHRHLLFELLTLGKDLNYVELT